MNKALIAVAIAILISAAGADAATGQPQQSTEPSWNRKLMQWWGWGSRNGANLNANTVRSQAATSQAILQAVETGGSLGATRGAARVGSNMSWAAAQGNQQVFDTVEWFNGGRKLRMFFSPRRA